MRRVHSIAALICTWIAASASGAPCAGFVDLDDSDPFCPSVVWLKSKSITLGCGPNLFCPSGVVDRLHLAVFLDRMGANVFQQGGNAFGAKARLGTIDGNVVEIGVFDPANSLSPYDKITVSPGGSVTFGHFAYTKPGVTAAVVGGGAGTIPNSVQADYGTVTGGLGNFVMETLGFVGGGFNNTAGSGAVVGGGTSNYASGPFSAILGGFGNSAKGQYSIVLGGHNAVAAGDKSLAAGMYAHTESGPTTPSTPHTGAFAWADGIESPFFTTNHNEFAVRATGGVRFVTAYDLPTESPTWTCGVAGGAGSSWGCSSDRELKAGLVPMDTVRVLEQVSALPIYQWYAKADPAKAPHAGPTAQDFYATFGLGTDNRMIGFADAQGVALGAIQALNAKLTAEVSELRGELAEMRRMLDEIKR